MFGVSTQYKYWLFKDESEISDIRLKVNEQYISKNNSPEIIQVSFQVHFCYVNYIVHVFREIMSFVSMQVKVH